MATKFKQKLNIVWRNNAQPKRYIPRSLNGGTGWGVWDRKEDRFIKDREIKTMDAERLDEPYTN